jgi:hypothetical protein
MSDSDKAKDLMFEIASLVRDYLSQEPYDRERVYEVLAALAWVSAMIVQGSDPDKTLAYFCKALNTALRVNEK